MPSAGKCTRLVIERVARSLSKRQIKRGMYLQLFSTGCINPPHDPLGPLNRAGYQRFGSRAWAGVVEVFWILQVTGHEDTRDNRQHTSAPFVHRIMITLSSFVRLSKRATLSQSDLRIECAASGVPLLHRAQLQLRRPHFLRLSKDAEPFVPVSHAMMFLAIVLRPARSHQLCIPWLFNWAALGYV